MPLGLFLRLDTLPLSSNHITAGVAISAFISRIITKRTIVLLILGIVALVGLAEAFLPSLAGRIAESRVSDYSENAQIDVDAFPAVKLLLGKADEVQMKADSVSAEAGQSLLKDLRRTDEFTGEIDTVEAGEVPIRDLIIHKWSDNRFTTDGMLFSRDISAALPPGVKLTNRKVGRNRIPFKFGEGMVGQGVEGELVINSSERGVVILRVELPAALSLLSLASITVFSDSHLFVEKITLDPERRGWRLSLKGRIT